MLSSQIPSNIKILGILLKNSSILNLKNNKDNKGKNALFYCFPPIINHPQYLSFFKNFSFLVDNCFDFLSSDLSGNSLLSLAEKGSYSVYLEKMKNKMNSN